jgi:hypothetical protein
MFSRTKKAKFLRRCVDKHMKEISENVPNMSHLFPNDGCPTRSNEACPTGLNEAWPTGSNEGYHAGSNEDYLTGSNEACPTGSNEACSTGSNDELPTWSTDEYPTEYSSKSDDLESLHKSSDSKNDIGAFDVTNDSFCNGALTVKSNQNFECSDLNIVLARWAIEHQIKHSALNDLLKILGKHHKLPKDARTLLKTKNENCIVAMQDALGKDGQFVYFSVEKVLKMHFSKELLSFYKNTDMNTIFLTVNIDGIPLFKSSAMQFWPILCKVYLDDVDTAPFVVGVFLGHSKPASVNVFLNEFVKEISHLETEGFHCNNVNYIVRIKAFVCDAPARAFIKCIKGHTGYYGCERCEQKGKSVARRVIFSEINSKKRTDESFIKQSQEEHHKDTSPLSILNIGLVTGVPLDYMHLICLGVMKRLMMQWLRGSYKVRISMQQVENISKDLLASRSSVCVEFQRRPRHLSEIDRWKAVEFRQFLLYTGPVVLRSNLPPDLYNHFMLLSVAVKILCCKEFCSLYCDLVEILLNTFVQQLKNLYGKESLVYNMHSVMHIIDDVRLFGALDNVSAFPFENTLGKLKRLLRTGHNPLSQLCRRLSEKFAFDQGTRLLENSFSCMNTHTNGPTMGVHGIQYQKVVLNNYVFDICKPADSFALTSDNKILKICNFVCKESQNTISAVNVIGKVFLVHENFFSYPCQSSEIQIYKINCLADNYCCISLEDIKRKCMVFARKEYSVVLPLAHKR